jgi:hypothetical protein
LISRKKREPLARKAKYQRTLREQTVLARHVARKDAETPAPRMKVLNDGEATTISLDHPDEFVGQALLMEALGTADADFANGLLRQLVANAGSHSEEIADGLNFMLSVVKGVKPKDQLEAMLAAQMTVVHIATLTFARQLAHVKTLPQQDSAERALNKLARTFATQMEALKRYRTGGEQKVTVQHVSVSEGGQAIVGNVTQAARESAPEKPANFTPALTDAQKPGMTIMGKPARVPVPLRRKQKDGGRSSA